MELRWYQKKAIENIFAYFRIAAGNPVIVAPTGSGKSVIIAEFCRQAIEAYPQTKIMVVTHVQELVEQNYLEFVGLAPDITAGIYSAGLGRRDIGKQVTFAGIQSIWKKAVMLPHYDLIIVDEAHTVPRQKKDGIWKKFLAGVKMINPYIKVIGLTATPYRMDSGMLTDGKEEDRLFTDIVYDIKIKTLIDEGYLCRPVSAPVETVLDVSGVQKNSSGDFQESGLQKAIDKDDITAAAVAEIVKHGQDRKAWLVFSSGNEHAYHIRDEIRRHGYTCEVITAKTPKGERKKIIDDYKAGLIRCLVNNMVLTTGFNAKMVDLIACLRPTHSAGLWVQILGRGLRLFAGKINCLVLDFARNIDRHGPLDDINPPRTKGEGGGEAPIKNCLECGTVCHAAARKCPDCGHEFPEPEIKIDARPSTGALLKEDIKPVEVDVTAVRYRKHVKLTPTGESQTLEVTYQCGLNAYREWVKFDGHNTRAAYWHRYRDPSVEAPRSVDDALAASSAWRIPATIKIRREGKYWTVIGANFNSKAVA